MDGTIKKLVSDKGFGFITSQAGEDVFFHRSCVSRPDRFEDLREGDAVTFEVEDTPKGLRASELRATS